MFRKDVHWFRKVCQLETLVADVGFLKGGGPSAVPFLNQVEILAQCKAMYAN